MHFACISHAKLEESLYVSYVRAKSCLGQYSHAKIGVRVRNTMISHVNYMRFTCEPFACDRFLIFRVFRILGAIHMRDSSHAIDC